MLHGFGDEPRAQDQRPAQHRPRDQPSPDQVLNFAGIPKEVLDQHLFARLEDLREAAYGWMLDYNEQRPHESLGDLTPAEYRQQAASSSTFEVSA